MTSDTVIETDAQQPPEKLHTNKAYSRMIDSQPILQMLDMLSKAGLKNFHNEGAWEICFCALVLKLEPQCKLQRLLEALPYGQDSMDDIDFLNAMAHLGYYCRPAETDLEEIDERLLPGVFIPGSKRQYDDNHIPSIVLGRDGDGYLQFFDPLSALVSNVPPSFHQNGKVWFFQKYDENRAATSKFMRQGSGQSWFRALLNRFKGTFAQVMIAGLILNIIALATPLFIMLVYDRVIAAGTLDTLPMLAIGAFIAILFEWRLRNIRSTGLSWLSGRLDNIVSNKIFAHLIGLSPDLIEKASVPAQIARIKTFESVRDFFSGSVFLSLLEAPFVFLSIAAVAFIAGPLVFVPLGMIAGYLILFHIIRQKIKIAIRLAAKASSARQQFTIETFEKLEGIRGHGLMPKWQEKFRHLSGREMMTHFRLGWLGMVAETTAHTLTILAAVSTIGFGVHLIWNEQMTSGALVASMILVWRILTPFYSLCTMVPRLEQLRNSIMQVNKLMDIDTEAEEAKSFSRLAKLKGAVSFHNVGFRYSDDADNIFADLSFEAHPGDIVAITGGNGAGKATILKLIQSLHRASSGVVRIDGFDIRQLDAPALRRQIAYVPKNAEFFHGSIVENMRISNPLATEDDIQKALELADAWEDVCKLVNGMHTTIGANGDARLTSSLSTRLSLARAYLHPASILLIDELPNTLLSGKAGQNLKNYLARAKGKRTIIICTYRDDYLQLSDTIIWLRGIEKPVSGDRNQILSHLKHGPTLNTGRN
jgi:ATP-binding cassette subfamily C protein LapB